MLRWKPLTKTLNEKHEDPEIIMDKSKTFNLKVTNAFNLDLLQTLYPKASLFPVCEGYKRNHCKHGRDGKTEVDGVTCKHLHPKKCFPWLNAGTNSKHGCNKGKDCDYYHPILCRNSVRDRMCLNAECTFAHLKYTKRYRKPDNNQPISDHRNSQENTVNRSQNNQQSPWISKPTVETNNDNMKSFLEDLVLSLRKDMQANQTEMREFKHNITKQMSQFHENLPQHQNQPQYQHQVHIDPNAVHHQVYQNQPQHHHQVHIDPSVAHQQIQHMQHIQVNQPEGAAFHQAQQHQMMMRPLGRT